ncbi:MAG: sulfatase family protein [Planctomycetota bacterium]
MHRRTFLKRIGITAVAVGTVGQWTLRAEEEVQKPNFVIIFIDDMGYGDIEPFGSTVNSTPHLNRMAKEGMKLTSFYIGWAPCTPSRSSLMTGCYAKRVGMDGRVCFPGEARGLNPDEITIADVLKEAGYATGCFGKWHLGDQPQFMPTKQGFDYYYGIPYSNDMWPLHPNKKYNFPRLPLLRNGDLIGVVEDGDDQKMLCKQFTDEAVSFIRKNRGRPFFVYLPHAFIHHPRFARQEFMEKAENETEAQIEETDWSTGQILQTLRDLNLEKKTLVIFTSDNGGSSGTSMGPLRGGKGGPPYEGQMREPTIAWWPGRIPAGSVCDEITSTMDLLPTFAKLGGTHAPTDRVIDGKDISGLLFAEPGAKSPHDAFFYQGKGVRSGKWKFLAIGEGELYNLEDDISERSNIVSQHPDIVKRLRGLLQRHVDDLEKNNRPAAFVENPKPILPFPKQ